MPTRHSDSTLHASTFRIVSKPEVGQKRASGNCASDRFPPGGCKEAHSPHTCAAHNQVFIGVSVKGWMIGRQQGSQLEVQLTESIDDWERP